MLKPTSGQPTPPPDVPAQRTNPPQRLSDIALATATAQAVRAAPGVVDLSAGRVALVATYGATPGERVTGVAIRRPTPHTVTLEAHVILSDVQRDAQRAMAPIWPESEGRSPPLAERADQIRAAVYAALRHIEPLVLAGVDVFIDDLR